MYPAGQAGMALYSYKLANALADQGLQVTLFVDDQYELDHLPAKFNKIKALSSKNVSIRSNRHLITRVASIAGAHFYNWHKFYCYVRRDRPEIVHIQSLFYPFDSHMLSYLKRINSRLVLTVHDVIPHKFYTRRFAWLELRILQHMYNSPDKLIVHTETNKEQLLTDFSVDEHKVVIIPHGEYSLAGISQEISEKLARSSLHLNDNDKVILYFGYIRKTKGIDILLKAFDRVAERFSDIVLVISGSVIQGESFSEHRETINKLKCRSRIKCFLKYVEHQDVPIFFTPADIVVLPYVQFHSQSGVLHLAQGFGKPVIATDVGGLPEVVDEGKTGVVVGAGDVEGLARAMTHLLENDGLRREMGQRAREMAMKRFSWEAIAEATIAKTYT
jgi:glycosyltransferase involved in cell wall biosynthesis